MIKSINYIYNSVIKACIRYDQVVTRMMLNISIKWSYVISDRAGKNYQVVKSELWCNFKQIVFFLYLQFFYVKVKCIKYDIQINESIFLKNTMRTHICVQLCKKVYLQIQICTFIFLIITDNKKYFITYDMLLISFYPKQIRKIKLFLQY